MRNASDPMNWETQSTEVAYANRWLTVAIDSVRLPDNSEYEYTRLESRAAGVAVIGFNAAGHILLEREYRHGVGQVIWQLPGGLVNEGEEPRSTGLRELLEETGFGPERLNDQTVTYLGSVWDNPAFGQAISHVYAAYGLIKQAEPNWDRGEALALQWVTPEWLREHITDGAIRDRVVLAAVAWLLLRGELP